MRKARPPLRLSFVGNDLRTKPAGVISAFNASSPCSFSRVSVSSIMSMLWFVTISFNSNVLFRQDWALRYTTIRMQDWEKVRHDIISMTGGKQNQVTVRRTSTCLGRYNQWIAQIKMLPDISVKQICHALKWQQLQLSNEPWPRTRGEGWAPASSLICVVAAEGSENASPVFISILVHFCIQASLHTENVSFSVWSMIFCSCSFFSFCFLFRCHHSLTFGHMLALQWCWKGLPTGG